jgi:hypothetical protein
MKGQVVFQFPKGYLEKADAGTVENAIAQVFSIGNDTQLRATSRRDNRSRRSGDRRSRSSQRNRSKPNPTQTIQLGQSTDEVQAALGKPEKIVNLGPKRLYVYKDLKIVFDKAENFGRAVATKNHRQSRARGAQSQRPG